MYLVQSDGTGTQTTSIMEQDIYTKCHQKGAGNKYDSFESSQRVRNANFLKVILHHGQQNKDLLRQAIFI